MPAKRGQPKTGNRAASTVKLALFHGLTGDEARLVKAAGMVQCYHSHSWLMRAGGDRQVFMVQSGLVKVYQKSQDKEVLLRLIGPGEAFGPAADASGQTAISAEVARLSRIMVWNENELLSLAQKIPALAINLFKLAAGNALVSYMRWERLSKSTIPVRVHWALAESIRVAGRRTGGGVAIASEISRQDLADLAGTNIFSVSRELNKLQSQGVLVTERARILILKPNSLVG